MRKILVPTDFSGNALKALAYAAEIAKKAKSSVILLHVLEPALNMATMQSDSLGKKRVKESSDKLNRDVKTAGMIYTGVRIKPYLAGGEIVPSILEYAEKEKIDLIVMGTKGARGLKKFFMGSVTAGAISETKIPILTVPSSYEITEPRAILFATNQFEKNKKILKRMALLPKLFGAVVHTVVFKDTGGDKNAELIYNDEQLDDYVQYLEEKFPDIKFDGALLEGKEFDLTIEEYSNKQEADMLVMITYPKSFFEKLLRKSVTRQMAYQTTIPILAIPAIS